MTGILPFRGSLMLDLVFLAMFLVVALLVVSVVLAKRGALAWHRNLQLAMAIVLAIAVIAFEVDMRFITKDWRKLAEPSPYYESGVVNLALIIHLCFAIPTPLWWVAVITGALRKFPKPPVPNEYSARHRRMGWIGVGLMVATSVTGWVFYALAFIA